MSFELTSLKGRTALVTGAGQGIGEAIAEALLATGAHVVAIDREAAGIEALAARSERVVPVAGDVTDPSLLEKIDAALVAAGLDIDILINNAGIARGTHALETSDDDLQRYLDINVKGVFSLSRWAIPRMIRRGGGSIVNTASVFGLIGAYNSAGYSISKAAVIGMTRQMATDFGPSGVRVNAVAPGLIETPLTAERIRSEAWRRQLMIEQTPLPRVGTPLDIARAVRFLASDEASFITGQVIAIDGGWTIGRFPRPEPIHVD
ncbi:MAG: SDR family oxidoreductase [Burkholderiaceae bacterium]|nr:SDR family oxidoreductase [Burkholderiaceae bacterium]